MSVVAGALDGDLDAFLRDEGGERHEAHSRDGSGRDEGERWKWCLVDSFALQPVMSTRESIVMLSTCSFPSAAVFEILHRPRRSKHMCKNRVVLEVCHIDVAFVLKGPTGTF